MRETDYNRSAAVQYAHRWALDRNPNYYDFDGVGGDCTNFVSQCLYAGCRVMNYTPDVGWYYASAEDRAAAWTGVEYLHRFLIANKGAGVYGDITSLDGIVIGDIIQLGLGSRFHHSCIVTGYHGKMPLVCAHTYDDLDRPLSEYSFSSIRYIHISGARIP